jgi:holo-[acyl-carrier protein] synthase
MAATDPERVLGLGVDIVETARIARSIERHGDAFLHRVFTAGEIAYCTPMRDPAPFYAARFAAKEAVAKALATGIGADLAWCDIEVVRAASGAPSIVLSGPGAATAARLGVREIRISMSHSEHYAVANALALG